MAATSRVYRTELVLGIFLIISLAILAYLAMQTGAFIVEDRVKLDVVFDDASGIVTDSAVMIAGVQIGRVAGLDVDHNQAIVHTEVNRSANVREDVEALIRARSLLGEKYIELKPQSRDAKMAPADFKVPSSHTGFSTEIDQLTTKIEPLIDKALVILNKIDPEDPAKDNLVNNLNSLAATLSQGLDGKGPALGSFIENTSSLTERLDGILARNDTRIDRVLINLDSLLADANNQKIILALNDLTSTLNPVMEDIQRRKVIPKLSGVLTRLDVIAARAELIDEMAIRKFLQTEGIKVHIRAY
ncbi:MAG: MlaD family protein [Deltaproteobacteria bacterium]|nr:MlaD family protein [Deltaproteobacteria bacterium]